MGWFPEQPGNGADRVYHALIQHLPDAGVGVRGLVVGSKDIATATGGRVRAFAASRQSLPARLWQVRRALRRKSGLLAESDLVAAHFALYAWPALDRLGERPFVMHFHGPWAGESRAEGEVAWKVRLKKHVEHRVYRRADRFIVLSDAFRDVLTQDYDISPERVRVVPGGVNVERFDTGRSQRAARERLGWPTDRPLALSVRRLVRRVGLEPLVTAMKTVRRRVPEALLLIAGKGPLAGALRDQIAAAGLEEHVRLLGFVPDADLPLAYRAADVSVVPTVALEGFGLIAAESLAAGTPPLVTPVGGLPEVVHDLSDGLVLPEATPGALADALAGALAGERPLPSAEACQAYARDRFAWPRVARQVRDVYDEVL
jgi:glycosyltransferase involved in cell wall biosynthesis